MKTTLSDLKNRIDEAVAYLNNHDNIMQDEDYLNYDRALRDISQAGNILSRLIEKMPEKRDGTN
jgi:hypothetical protein